MGLPAKVLADDETALLVLRPHVRRLVRPALVLLLLAPAAGYALGAVPAGATQATIRAVVAAAVAAIVALRWVSGPSRSGGRRSTCSPTSGSSNGRASCGGAATTCRCAGITDVVVAQRLGERLLRTGTLSVTTEGGARFTMTDVPGVLPAAARPAGGRRRRRRAPRHPGPAVPAQPPGRHGPRAPTRSSAAATWRSVPGPPRDAPIRRSSSMTIPADVPMTPPSASARRCAGCMRCTSRCA